ncbi:MAG: DMT family transporter [Simkaniaceae bacterium]|nr:DMT family transporter [Simkaniaceae bacterium]
MNYALLLLIAACWGPSFLFIKLGVAHFGPSTFVAMRVGLAALLFFGLTKIRGTKMNHSLWKEAFIIGLVANALPFVLISYGETRISSSLGSMINATVPLFTALIARQKLRGVMIGIFGLFVIFSKNLIAEIGFDLLGASLVLIASLSYAIAMIFSRRIIGKSHPYAFCTMQFTAASLMMLPFALFEKPWLLSAPPMSACIGVLGATILGTFIAFVLYYVILHRAGPTFLSYSTLLFPVVGMVLGSLVLSEELGLTDYLGAGFVLLGLLFCQTKKDAQRAPS